MKTAEEKREVDKTETNVKEEAAEKTERVPVRIAEQRSTRDARYIKTSIFGRETKYSG